MSDTLDGALQHAESVQLRRAARALLRRPLLRADGPQTEEFQLVRRHAARLRTWFDLNTGWRLIVDSEVARLTKIVPATTDATHPARDARSGLPFGRRRYVLTCLALAVLERADSQITLGWLADRLILAAADEEIAQAGVVFRLEGRDERSDVVAVVRLLLSLGVLARVAGDEDAFVRDAGDVLYDVQRRSLALLLAAPRGPSIVAAASFEERLAALAEEHAPEVDELRNRALRQRITRRLLDDAVLYHAELDAAEAEYLGHQRGAIVQRISELTGLVAEVRAEGIAMVDPEDDLTDVRMPDTGTDGHVSLLIAEHLARAAVDGDGGGAIAVEELHRLVRGLAHQHRAYWRKDAGAPGAEVALVAAALERLEALRLVVREPGVVRPLPALARYAVAEPTLLGNAAST
ncbi:MAG: hypothetical protein QOJ63_3312 [Solirubrobacteraceae bacterium]|nr:hypothetical protein [Solirubrobacteraceae bacterium]